MNAQVNVPAASVLVFPSVFVRSSNPVTERLPTIVVHTTSTSLFAGSAFALSVAGVPTVAPAGAVQMPLSTGFAAIVGKPCCEAGAGLTARPSVTVNAMCGNGREATTGCCCGFK